MTNRKKLPKKTSEKVFLKFNFHCFQCLARSETPPNATRTEQAHLIPLHLGGSNEASNFVLLCDNCHRDFDRRQHYEHLKLTIAAWRRSLSTPTLQEFRDTLKSISGHRGCRTGDSLRVLWQTYRSQKLDISETVALLTAEAEAQRRLGHTQLALDTLALASRFPRHLLPRDRANIESTRARTLYTLGNVPLAIGHIQLAINALQRDGDSQSEMWWRCRQIECSLLYHQGPLGLKNLSIALESLLVDGKKTWPHFSQLRASLMMYEARLAQANGDNRTARKMLENSSNILEKEGDPRGASQKIGHKGMTLVDDDQFLAGAKLLAESRKIRQGRGDFWGAAVNDAMAGDAYLLHFSKNDSRNERVLEKAISHYIHGAKRLIQIQDEQFLPTALDSLAAALFHAGRFKTGSACAIKSSLIRSVRDLPSKHGKIIVQPDQVYLKHFRRPQNGKLIAFPNLDQVDDLVATLLFS